MAGFLQVRAFADWPGTKATFQVINTGGDVVQNMDLKIITSRHHYGQENSEQVDDRKMVVFRNSSIVIFCEGNSSLEVKFKWQRSQICFRLMCFFDWQNFRTCLINILTCKITNMFHITVPLGWPKG